MSTNVVNNVFRLKEKYGLTGNTNIYAKPLDQNTIVKLSAHETCDNNVKKRHFLHNFFREVFLPQGYPKSVSDDYFSYQFYDTIQAFASRITGTIATKAILKGVGVGNPDATALAAAITWIFKDGTGMFGSIVFAWWKGTEFDSNCKKWRLFADVLNDAAMLMELLVPYCMSVALPLLCTTTCMKAAVGVAGGATRAAITQHQAVGGNSADVAAKDGSQETAVNLVASIFGIIVLMIFEEGRFEWTIFLLFTMLHLFANYLAVSALVFPTLNTARLVLVLRSYCRFYIVPSPDCVNRSESVILGQGHSAMTLCGFDIKLGQSLQKALHNITYTELKCILDIYKDKGYLVIPDVAQRTINIVFQNGESSDLVISAYFHAVVLGLAHCILYNTPLEFLQKKTSQSTCLLNKLRESLSDINKDDHLDVLRAVTDFVNGEVSNFIYELEKHDWRTNTHCIQVDDWRLDSLVYN